MAPSAYNFGWKSKNIPNGCLRVEIGTHSKLLILGENQKTFPMADLGWKTEPISNI